MEFGPAQVLDSLGEAPASELLGPHGPDLEGEFGRPFRVLHRALELYTAGSVLGLLGDLGLDAPLRRGATLEGLCAGLPDQARVPLAWMLSFLAQEGLLEARDGLSRLPPEGRVDLEGLRALAEAEAPGQGIAFDLIAGVRRHIRPFFASGTPGEALLFDLTLFPLWLAYFRNDNPVYRPNNLFALLALREGLPEGARILELGAGAGSFARMVAERAGTEGWAGRLAEYRFTDVAPAFLRKAQRELPSELPGFPLAFQSLDLDRPLEDQGIATASLDAIVAINVVHVARDLHGTLRDLRSRLKPEGRLIVGECLKPALDRALYQEFAFSFLSSFTAVDLDPRWRPAHGFLTPELWQAAVAHAGFGNSHWVPDVRPLMDRHPAFNAGALVAHS